MKLPWPIIALFCLGFSFAPAQEEESKATDAPVEVNDITKDEAIENRLNGIFEEVRELAGVTSKVTAGVVRLSGTVPDEGSREDALALARRTNGVIYTVDRMEVTAEVGAQLSPTLKKLQGIWTGLVTKLPLIGIAILIVGVAIWIANFLHRRDGWAKLFNVSSLTKLLLRRILRFAIIGSAILVALEILDATAVVGAILGAAGLAGLALGFAFRNIAENYLGGILLSTRNPFEIGDAIEVNGKIGKVAMLSARDTVLITPQGNHLRIPNSVVMNSELLNYTRNPLRRFEFTVGVSVNLDLNEARKVGLAAMKSSPGVLVDPKPTVTVDSLGDSTVILNFFGWIDQGDSDFLKARSETIRIVKVAFDEAGIEMPEPIYRVHLRGGEAAAPSGIPLEAGTRKKSVDRPAEEKAGAEVSVQDSELNDISPDRTIEEHIETEQLVSKEENLLDDND